MKITQKERFKLEDEWDRWLMSIIWTAEACGKKTGYFNTFGALADRAGAVSEWMHRHAWDSYFANKVMDLLDDIRDVKNRFGCEFPSPPQSLIMFLRSQIKAPIPLVDYT
jgi:hypothetical protein